MIPSMRGSAIVLAATFLAVVPGPAATAQAQNPAAAAQGRPFPVEYYYKVQWGYLDEWLSLYRRNHWPVLKRLKELGRIVDMSAASPVNHAGEDRRWDFRFTIVWRDVVAAHEPTDAAIIRALFPDQETFRKEEQRRFALLLEHMDVPVRIDDLKGWP